MNRILLAACLALLGAACVQWNSPFADKRLRISEPSLESAIVDAPPPPSEPEPGPLRELYRRINADRAAEGRLPVAWDASAAALGANYTSRQVLESTLGHFLFDGIPPYARASRREVFGYGAENAAAFSVINGVIEESPTSLLLRAHEQMLQERPPNDGHRRTILDADATHVGIGWHRSQTEFRMVEEFTCRRYSRLSVAPTGVGAAIVIRGMPQAGENLEYVTVAREPTPKPLSRDELRRRHSYAYPNPSGCVTAANSPLTYGGLKSERLLTLSFDRRFAFRYEMDQPGLWTFVFYFRADKSRLPPKPGASISLTVATRSSGV